MKLTEAQLKQWNEQGYLAIDPFFTPRETDALRAELERMYEARRQAGASLNVAIQADGTKRKDDGELQNLQLIPLNDKSRLYRALPFHSKVSATVGALIGSSFRLHLDQSFWKPARQGIGTQWHQDNAYFKIPDPLRGTAMWIAIHDATIENGTIHVIPASYKEQYEHYRDPLSDHHIRCDPPNDKERERAIELKAGGVAFFCYGTAHCTKENRTDHDRAGVALHFLHTDFTQHPSWETNAAMRPIVGGPQASGGMNEYGRMVEGTWEAEVDAVLG